MIHQPKTLFKLTAECIWNNLDQDSRSRLLNKCLKNKNVYIASSMAFFSLDSATKYSIEQRENYLKFTLPSSEQHIIPAHMEWYKKIPYRGVSVWPLDPRFPSDKVYILYLNHETDFKFVTNNIDLMKEHLLSYKGVDQRISVIGRTVDVVECKATIWNLEEFIETM
jgi:hypothetical protein